MAEQQEQVCPVCSVKIIGSAAGDRVVFSSGPEGSRAKLWARVCQFVDKPACINRDRNAIGQVGTNDYFKAEPPAIEESGG
ncbi:MAG: hypothetical protein HC857_03870 [Synechococcales cyanobacterium RU_4_20]|nr:hypothetical protein [Synechococcales cyanobacterium RU_4_20]NJR68393.1 hypothetical protein [Synechococcales cyanobacterium CRU_2_2]